MEDGAFISARGLAAELDTSFTPVREALVRLSNEGYLDRIPSVGFFKTRMDFGNLHHYFESRVIIESYILPMVVRTLGKDDIAHLRELIRQQNVCWAEKNIVGYGEIDIEFHAYLIEKHGNKQMSQFYRSLREQNRTYSKQTYYKGQAITEHNQFLDLIEQKKFDEAANLMLDTLRSFEERVRQGSVRL